MRKRRMYIALLIIIFILGMIVASQKANASSQYFEHRKDEFESEIKKPDNQYSPSTIAPKASTSSKVAHGIDQKITSLCQKVKELVASMFE